MTEKRIKASQVGKKIKLLEKKSYVKVERKWKKKKRLTLNLHDEKKKMTAWGGGGSPPPTQEI